MTLPWLPENLSTYGSRIDQVFYLVLAITGVIFVLVEATLVVFLIRYRRRPNRRAIYYEGNERIEIVWTAIPAVIMVCLALFSQRVWSDIRGAAPVQAHRIRIQGEQFAWNVRYPGGDGQFDTPDDVTTINQLHLPVGQPVVLELSSKDVIHSLFLPHLRVKQDAVPGLPTHVWVEATKSGQYEVACAELCGLGHYRMRGYLTIESPEAFETWLQETKAQE